MGYKLAIFDLDGTILYTLEDLADTTNYVMAQMNMPLRTLDEVRCFVGNGIRRLLEQAVVPGTSEAEIDQALDIFTEHYKIHCADKTRPYDGINEVLGKLREKKILTAVVSNKADYGVQSLCADYFPGMFDYVVGEREGIRRKPFPDSVNAVLEKFSISKEEAIYIGDSEVDYATAQNAQIDVLMVGWGFREETMLREIGAKEVLRDPEEILSYFD